jgi:hypothetical protein
LELDLVEDELLAVVEEVAMGLFAADSSFSSVVGVVPVLSLVQLFLVLRRLDAEAHGCRA